MCSEGLKKGLIVNPEQVVKTLENAIKEINEKLGVDIKKVIVNVPDYNASFRDVSGSVEIKNDSGVITSEDISEL